MDCKKLKLKLKRKKNSDSKLKSAISLKKNIRGVFNGQFITVTDLNSMNYLHELGNFGKGSLSKGEPKYHTKKDDIPRIMLRHQYENQAKWTANAKNCHSQINLKTSRNDYEVSYQSISNFFQSSFSDTECKCSKLKWKNHKQKQENLEDLGSLSLLKFNINETEYKDEIFINFVNDILESREIKKQKILNSTEEKVVILNGSFSFHQNEFPDSSENTQLEKLPFSPEENLNLNLEESFFLKSVFGNLNIFDVDSSEMAINGLWDKFSTIDKSFTERYISYHYYKKKGWIIKSGLKFGGDYLLYKDGPAYYHASFLVKVSKSRKFLSWKEFIAMNRLVETFNKDLLLSIIQPTKMSNKESYSSVLANHSVEEILIKRWLPTKERLSRENKLLPRTIRQLQQLLTSSRQT